MLVLMLRTLFGTGPAYISAHSARLHHKLTLHTHKLRSEAADSRALYIQRNTLSHHVDVRLLQAGNRTVITGCCAFIAGLDTVLIIMLHMYPPLFDKWRL